MSEPQEIVAKVREYFSLVKCLEGKKALVTAGGTQEPMDPVRYLGNRSSGLMGYAVAQALQEAGAETTLISAPTAIEVPAGVKRVSVTTALEMYEAVMERFPENDIIVKAAAVADYRPVDISEQKIKKQKSNLYVELISNPDILDEIGRKKTHQFLVGFAAETENLFHMLKKKWPGKMWISCCQ